MPTLLALSRADVATLLPPILDQIELVAATYQELAEGGVEAPPKPGIHPRADAFIHAMPAYIASRDIAAIKWVSGYPANPSRGLPYISGVIVVNDPETGVPAAVMDAAEITAARTAAASGICIQRWAPLSWTRAAILGCGEQGLYHAAVLRTLNPSVELRGYDPDAARVGAFPGIACATPEEALADADVVITAGPIVANPTSPLKPNWLGSSWLCLPIDFDFYAAASTVEAADLFLVDDVDQFAHYRSAGHFTEWPMPDGSVGAALSQDDRPARVLCANLGIGALDAAFAGAVLEQARANAAGTTLAL